MNRIDHWLHREFASDLPSLALYRVLFASVVLLTMVPEYAWISRFSDAFFYPAYGPALFFDGFPQVWFFHVLHFLLVLATLSLLVGYQVRWASLAVGLLLLVGNLWAYSFGKINHDSLLIVVPLVMAFSGWGTRLGPAPGSPAPLPGWPLALLALLIALAMLTAALPKLTSGWLHPESPVTLGHLLRNIFVTERPTLVSNWLVQFDQLMFWKFVDYATLLIEFGFLCALVSRRAFRLVAATACGFHLGVWLIMGIAFADNLLAYAAFVNWALLLGWRPLADGFMRFDGFCRRVTLGPLVGVALALVLGLSITGNPWARAVQVSCLMAGSVIALIYVFRCAQAALSRIRHLRAYATTAPAGK